MLNAARSEHPAPDLACEEREPNFASGRDPPSPAANAFGTIRKEIAAVELALGPTFSDAESYQSYYRADGRVKTSDTSVTLSVA